MNMEINGIDRVCLRDSGSSIDVCSRSWINEDDLLGEYVWLKRPLDEICHFLPLTKIKIKTKKGEFYTKAAIKQDSSDNDLYLLGNRTAELLEDVEEFVKTCDLCQRVGKPRDKAKAPLKLVPILSEVSSKINIDAVGPLPVSTKQNRYLITSICVASKYPEAIPVESITSPNVIDALLSIFSRIGFPREIQSDLGTSFTSELTTTFFNKFGIKVTRSSVSHPQSNAVERVHRTIKRVIKALCVESGEDWEGVLPLALFSLRTVAHECTGFSPTELVMGKNLRTPQTTIASPLTDALNGKIKKEKITWDEKCGKAFEELKAKFVTQPILFAPDFATEFILQTDASEVGAGVVLSQRIEGEEHPIVFPSKKFSKAERNYSTVERELAAIIFGLKRLKHKFIIETDHNPLRYLNKMGSTNPRLQRWALSLQPFNFEIKHKPGRLHGNADGLSRLE
ncbi:retrovirus-related Pol polyprotein from transposon 297 [Trichonephila clavipes]|nr:retrovirus-related Pol polyprotein from transposon 297 [Trichonephila clavipes]